MDKRVTHWLALTGLAFFLLVSGLLAGCSKPMPEILKFTGPALGSRYNVSVVGIESEQQAHDIKTGIEQQIQLINSRMSTYRSSSELSKFNRLRQTDTPFAVSQQTATVVGEALRIGELSGGALDITVGPLVNLWGFGPDAEPERIPTPQKINQALERSGLELLSFDGQNLVKHHPQLYIDLSAIAKGYAADRVAHWLTGQGYANYLVEVGGEMVLRGQKPGGVAWKVAVEKPVSYERSVQRIIAPGDNAVATSGDYRNYFERDGKRYSHTIDPQTGRPIEHKLVSATVIAPSCMSADGYATALMVMGPEQALRFATEQQLAVLLISNTEDGYIERWTAQFEPYLVDN